MSLFSGNTKKQPSAQIKTLGMDERLSSTNQQARPVPYIAGRQRIALTWLCDAFGVIAHPIRQKIGKKKQTVGYSYFASFAGLIGAGPFDRIRTILFDGEIVWTGPVDRSGDSAEITIPTRGVITLYWGTETQTEDAHLATSGQNHPAYRGQGYMVFNALALGQNRTQVPNVEVVIERYPLRDWMESAPDVEGDANLIAVIADWLQNPRYGLGLADDRLDLEQLNATAAQLVSEDLSLSPVITRASTARQLIVQALEYVDGYLTTGADGKLQVQLIRPIAAPASLPSIAETDLVDVPNVRPGSWTATKNETHVNFTNRDRSFQDDAISWTDPANFVITGEHRPQSLDRPWCTRGAMAQRIAQITGTVDGLPTMTGALTLRASIATSLRAGDAIRFSYARLNLEALVVRIIGKSIPSPARPEVKIDWAIDRGDLNDLEFEPIIDAPPETPTYAPEPNAAEVILEAPLGLPEPAAIEELICLAARATGLEIGFNVHRRLPSETYAQEYEREFFAVHGLLAESYPAETFLVDDALGLLVDLDGVDLDFDNRPLADALTNDVLLYAGDEILCPFDAVLITGSTWRIYAIRARYDTIRTAHAADAQIWIQERARGAYVPSDADQPTQTWKLQPYSINREVPIAEVDPINVATTHRALRPYRPLNLTGNGLLNEGFYATGEDVDLAWTITMELLPNFWALWPTGQTENLPETVLQFRDAGTDALVEEIEMAAGVASLLYESADIVAAFGSEVSFRVRAYHRRNSFLSAYYSEIIITKL